MSKNAVDALLESAGSIPEAVSADLKPPLPKTQGEVKKLATDQMDALVEAHGLGMPGEWGEASAAEKHKMLNVVLGFVASKKGKKGATAAESAAFSAALANTPITVVAGSNPDNLAILEDNDEVTAFGKTLNEGIQKNKNKLVAPNVGTDVDPISKVAQDIEGMTDQVEIEGEITTLLASEGMNDFRLGGLMLKLLEVGTFPDNSTFKEYIGARWGLKYRKAMYLVELYNGLLKSGVAWETVAGIGWSKVITLLKVLTPENADEWVAKAKQYNNDTLQAAVKAALAGDGNVNPNDAKLEQSKLKTLTFGVGPDQEELIKEAVEHAMQVGQTEHKGVALELICTEYLGNTSGMTTKPKKADKLVPGTMTLEQHNIQLQSAITDAMQPKAIFQYFLAAAKGDIPTAMGLLFGDAFDEVFDSKVTLDMNIAS